MVNDVYKETEQRMEETCEHFRRELGTIRTGRASATLLENIRISYYGTITPVNRLANIATPESNIIVIQPWDISLIGEIEKALQKSDLGLNPQSDGKIIRLLIPPLSQERRLQLVKNLNKQTEENKVALRNIRRDANEMVKELEKEKEISEDTQRKALAEIQKITDKYIKKLDEMMKKKEQEILST